MALVGLTSQSPVVGRPRYTVQMRVNWWDEWQTVNYLTPVRWFDSVSPNMPTAYLTWDAGKMLRAERPAGVAAEFVAHGFLPDAADAAHAFLADRLDGRFVRICSLAPPSRPGLPGEEVQLWIGVVVSDGQERFGYEDFSGTDEAILARQTITCYGLAHLLNIDPILRAYVVNREMLSGDDAGHVSVPAEDAIRLVEWAPDFNKSYGHGLVARNMCAPHLQGAAFALPGNDPAKPNSWLRCFADDAGPALDDPNWPDSAFLESTWTDEQKALYLLFFHQPFGNAAWNLLGDPPPADTPLQFYTMTANVLYGRNVVTRQSGHTIWEIFGKLAHADLGLAWRVQCPDASDPEAQAEVVFYSRFDEDVTFADVTIPGNSDKVNLTVADKPGVRSCVVQESNTQKYDVIRVDGDRIVACFPMAGIDGTLDKAWPDSTEQMYKDGAAKHPDGSDNADYVTWDDVKKTEQNDRVRLADRFQHVFVRFQIPENWDWLAGDGEGTILPDDSDLLHDVRITPLVSGGLGFYGLFGDKYGWRHRRPLLRYIPLLEGVDYADPDAWDYSAKSPYTGIPNGVPGVSPIVRKGTPRLRPIVFLRDETLDPPQWVKAEDVGAYVGMAQDNSAIEVRFSVNHMMAKGWWSPAEPTALDPATAGFDYFNGMICIVAIELDDRISVAVDVTGAGPRTDAKVLTISVAGAGAAWIAPNTPVGLDANGQLRRTPDGISPTGTPWARGVVQNDSYMLQAVAAVAKAWFGTARNNVELTASGEGIDGLTPYGGVEPGQMLDVLDPQSVGNRTDVRSLITMTIYDNTSEAGAISLKAGSGDVEPVVIARRA